MTEYTELVKRLRTESQYDQCLYDVAADAIESLSAQLAERDAEVARLTTERDAAVIRADNHVESLRSIREMAREGDCERIILWVSDSLSGYMMTAAETLKQAYDERNAARKERDAARNDALREAAEALRKVASYEGDPTVKVAMYADANFILELTQ